MKKLLIITLLLSPLSALAFTASGWNYSTGLDNFAHSSTSPTFNYIVSTSTTATSTFGYGINLRGGCFAINGTCITGGGTTYTGTFPISISGSVISYIGLATSTNISAGGNIIYATGVNTVSSVATSTLTPSSPLTGSFVQIGTGGALGIQASSASQNGYLSLLDYQLIHSATTTFTSPLVYTLSTNAVTCPTCNVSSLSGSGSIGLPTVWSSTNSLTSSSTLSANVGGTGSTTLSGILKGGGTGQIQTAILGTDYVNGSGVSGNCVKWGANNSLADQGSVCGSGSGGSGGGTWSTTTSQTTGVLNNYPNNATDVVVIGSNSTTTSEMWFDPNLNISYLQGRLGIGTTSPYNSLSVVGTTTSSVFEATSTATSTFAGGVSASKYSSSATSTLAGLYTTRGLTIGTLGATILKTDSSGNVIPAVSGTDYQPAGTYVTTVTGTYPIVSSGGTTPNLTWVGISTSSPITAGANVLYATGVNTFASVSTSTPTVTAPITYSGTLGSFVGGVAGTFDCTSANATTKGCITAGDYGKALSGTTTAGTGLTYTLATNSFSITAPVSIALGGTNSTSIPSRNLVWFDGTSITSTSSILTVGSIIGTTTATSTFLGGLDTTKIKTSATSSEAGVFIHTGGLTIGTANCSGLTNGGKLTTDSSGNVSCANDVSGGGGGSNNGVYGQIGWYASDGSTLSATGTQLTIGNLLSTTTATSTFIGPIVVGSSTLSMLNSYLSITAQENNYIQTNIQNKSNGNNASSAYVATANNGTDSSYFAEFGINGASYAQSTMSAQNAGDAFLNSQDTGLVIGTSSSTNPLADLRFVVGGMASTTTASSSIAMVIDNPTLNVGIGTTSPWGKLSIFSASSSISQPLLVVASSTGTKTDAPYLVVSPLGNIGIGTTSPFANLTILATTTTASDQRRLVLYIASSTPTTVSPLLAMTSRGQLMVGTSTPRNVPDDRITVYAPGSDGDTVVRLISDIGSSAISITGAQAGQAAFQLNEGSTNKWNIFKDSNANANLQFGNGVRNVVTFTQTTGRVGIGSTTPYTLLGVAGEVVAQNFTATSTTASSTFAGAVGIGSTTPNSLLTVVGTGLDKFLLRVQGQQQQAWFDRNTSSQYSEFVFGTAGVRDWTIGTRASDSGFYLGQGSTGSVSFPLYIATTGNVGVGSTSPSSKLSVAGQIMAGNFIGTTTATSTIGGAFGIASTSPWRKLSVDGTVAFNGLTTSTAGNAVCILTTKDIVDAGANTCVTSSIKTKHDVRKLDIDDSILKLKPVQYVNNEGGDTRYGLIAEDVYKIDPTLVELAKSDIHLFDGQVIKKGEPITVDYQRSVVAKLIDFAQRTWNRITVHEDRISDLEKQVKLLQDEINKLKK